MENLGIFPNWPNVGQGLVRDAVPYQNACFFIKFTKGGGGSFPFIKVYDGKFVYSGGLRQHEIGIEKVF